MSLITVLAVAIGAIGINILVYFLSDEYNLNFDVSNERLYSLSDETKELIEGLNQDIYIYSLYPTGEEDRYVSKLLDNYDAASERIKVENIDRRLIQALRLSTIRIPRVYRRDLSLYQMPTVLCTMC